MNIRSLRVGQMVAVARHMLGPARETLLALPGGETFVTHLESFLQIVTAPTSALAQQIAALDELLVKLDGLHDRLLRGLFMVIGGLAELTDDPAKAKWYRGLQGRLLPEGLAGINRTLLEEATMAEGARGRLLEGDGALLVGVANPEGGTLDDVVTRWAETGVSIREAENERAELRAKDGRLSLAKLGEARRAFGRLLGHLESTLNFHNVDVAVREKLMSKLVEVIEAAAERQRRQRAGEKVEADDVLPLVSEGDPAPA